MSSSRIDGLYSGTAFGRTTKVYMDDVKSYVSVVFDIRSHVQSLIEPVIAPLSYMRRLR
jgi:hypothetical protein